MIDEALFSASAGLFLAICDALEMPAAKAAIESLRDYATDIARTNPLAADSVVAWLMWRPTH
jgi:hypothetical protein